MLTVQDVADVSRLFTDAAEIAFGKDVPGDTFFVLDDPGLKVLIEAGHWCNQSITKLPLTSEVTMQSEVGSALDAIYSFCQKSDTDGGQQFLFSKMEEWMQSGRFDMCDLAIKTVSLSRLNEGLAFAFLVVTHPIKDNMYFREHYFKAASEMLAVKIGPERANALLPRYA